MESENQARKMGVEADSQKPPTPNTGETRNPNPNGNPRPQQGGENDDEDNELEEGEIVGEEKPSGPVTYETHPLEHQWTFWFDNPGAKTKQAVWGSSMRSIYTFSTVEEFWSVYNNICRPSQLASKADLHCFKYKIEPKWEDPVCANGGRWTVSCSRGKSDTSWLYTLLAMIGEQFDHGDEICGAVVNIRDKVEKIALWTKNASNEAAQLSIGKQWKEFLDYNDAIGFEFHDDAKKSGKAGKSRYTV